MAVCQDSPEGQPLLLYITRKYPPSVGGMEAVSLNLSQELARRMPVRLIAFGGTPRTYPLFLLRMLIGIRSVIRVPQPVSLIFFGDLLSAFAEPLVRVLLPGVPVVAAAHGLDVVYPWYVYQQVVRRILGRIDHVVCNSERTRDECILRGARLDRCAVVHPGVAISDEDPPTLARRDAARRILARRLDVRVGTECVLLSVGRLVPRKGVAWFVTQVLPRLRERHPSIRYVILGRGPEEGRIRCLVRTAKLLGTVEMLGEMDDSTRDLLYRAADVFVMPNLAVPGDLEGFGVVAREAAAAGLWSVAASVDGVTDAITRSSGSLLPARATEAWVSCLDGLASDRARCARLGAVARRCARRYFGWSVAADHYVRIFTDVRERGRTLP